jgi:uncharacterized membrane protein
MLIANISLIGWLHTIACLIALPAGAYVLAARKGTSTHRLWGWWYVGAMVALNLSAFFIYRFDIVPGRGVGPGRFGIFHWSAVAALASVVIAVFAAIRQRRNVVWAHVHAQAMLGSYYGLIGGLINEMFARIAPLRALALQLTPGAGNITRTALVGMVQGGAMLAWFALAALFFLQVAKMHRRHDSNAFTIGYPLRYSGGLFSGCIGLGGIIGAFTGALGWGFILGAALGLFLSRQAQCLVRPVWGQPSARQQTTRMIALGLMIAVFMLLGSIGFFQSVRPVVAWETNILVVGCYFLLLRGSHGPMALWLGVSVLAWLGAGHVLHLPLQLLVIGDGLIKLGFGFAMSEPLLYVCQRPSRALTSEGVAPASRSEASVTA